MVTGTVKPTLLPLPHRRLGGHRGHPTGAWWLGAALVLGMAAGAAAARPAPAGTAASARSARSAPSAPSAAATPASPASAAARNERFTHHGLTPAAAGQTVAQAEAALGQPLRPEPAPPVKTIAAPPAAPAATKGCHFMTAARQPGVRYTVLGDQISRIETRDTRYATVKGVRVGDPLDRARKVYGKRLKSTPHPYFDNGRMLTLYSSDRSHALVMESNDQGRIITLRGGRVPEVTWLEGCS